MIVALFRTVVDRIKWLLATAAAQELESDFLAREAERKSELLRQAENFQSEGLTEVAQQLRRQAGEMKADRPLAVVLPALAHWQNGTASEATLLVPSRPAQLPAPVKGRCRKGR